MKQQWFAMEHYRMHSIEEWPEGPFKESALIAVRSALASLARFSKDPPSTECQVCLARRRSRVLIEMPLDRAA